MLDKLAFQQLPVGPGVGYKPQHFTQIMDDPAPVEWFEIHAENYMGAGGRPRSQLQHLSERFAISVHGVGLSIGGSGPLDPAHLARLRDLCGWLNPARFSEHLAWSSHAGGYLNDLLPLPYTPSTLDRVCDHVDLVQETLGRRMLLENPSVYLDRIETSLDEIDFLTEIASRTGCGLLLDVNNVFVSCTNRKTDAGDYISRFPMEFVEEIHLGGHDEDTDEEGARLLIDAHGVPVADTVWRLFEQAITLGGKRATLVEWDNDVPDWKVLAAEAARVASVMARVPS